MTAPWLLLRNVFVLLLLAVVAAPQISLAQDAQAQSAAEDSAQSAAAAGGDQQAAAGDADLELGKKVYEQNCQSCHNLNDQALTGPGFYEVSQRWNGNTEEMIYFIRHGAADYQDAGREYSDYVSGLVEEYGQLMPAQPVDKEQSKAVLAYVKAEAAPAEQASGGPGGGGNTVPESVVTELTILATILGVAVVALLIIAVFVIGTLKAREKGASFTGADILNSLRATFQNKYLIGAVGFVVLIAAFAGVFNIARSVGLHQGYKPVQPVAFSHELHAGQYQIECEYCHIGVTKSKSATIPATNICQNCHHERGGIQEGPKHGEKELAKVLASAENERPIEWVRIHNLPDLVYFNHSQHVAVAGLECQECHGEVEKMEEVYQVNKLSMGWCLDCHRTKKVDVTKNAYYQHTHGAYAVGEETKVTVAELGGQNCARCHY